MASAISLILLKVVFSFQRLSLFGKDRELPCQPCGYMADGDQHVDDFLIRRALVVNPVHIGYLQSGACRSVLLTLPTGGEGYRLTKEG